jgi:RNA polymerase sigma-70 factor (ECF subfamily)
MECSMTSEDSPVRSPTAAQAPPLSDHSLLRRFRRGSQDAATQLYLRYAQRLRCLVRARCSPQLARRVEPDDIVQSIFRRFFRRVSRGDYDVPPGEELWGLFLVIALNKLRAEEAFHRADKRDVRLAITVGSPQELLETQAAGDDGAYAVLQLTIDDVLADLPQQSRLMVELRIQGHDVAEIARHTGRSKRTIERSLQEFRTRLRHLLEGKTAHEADSR